jgi:quercetin dioxygenase-like cupin family protein
MALLIEKPSLVAAAGNKPKIIHEYIGRVNTQNEEVSIAHMQSPEGWVEPAQTPDFTEYTVVLKGVLHVETGGKKYRVAAGQALITYPGERVVFSTPESGGAEYIAVCLPAFSLDLAHREG